VEALTLTAGAIPPREISSRVAAACRRPQGAPRHAGLCPVPKTPR